MVANPAAMAEFCYLTTVGRKSGRPHTVEMWYADHGGTVYMLSGGRDRSDWVRNLLANPQVQLRIGEQTWEATARVLQEGSIEDGEARRRVVGKYQPGYGDDLSDWGRTSLVVAVDRPS